MAKNSGEFAVNQRVSHHVYGCGTISMIDERHTVIEFDEHGRRKFVTSLMQLEPSDVAAPTKPRSRSRKAKAPK